MYFEHFKFYFVYKNVFQRIILSCIFFKILTELGGFEVKESKFRREMEKLRNQQSRDLSLEVKVFRISYAIYIKFKNKN